MLFNLALSIIKKLLYLNAIRKNIHRTGRIDTDPTDHTNDA